MRAGSVVVAAVGLALGGLALVFGSKPKASSRPPLPEGAPNPDDYSGPMQACVANAMRQVASELERAGDTHAAAVYREQANAAWQGEQGGPPHGTAARALERVADELAALGYPENVGRLRAFSKKLFPAGVKRT